MFREAHLHDCTASTVARVTGAKFGHAVSCAEVSVTHQSSTAAHGDQTAIRHFLMETVRWQSGYFSIDCSLKSSQPLGTDSTIKKMTMTIFSHQTTSIRRAIMASLLLTPLLTPVLGMQSAHAHEFSALIKAKKYAEVERAIGAKLATNTNDADALLAKVDLILIEGKVVRLDEGVKFAEQCIAGNPQNSECHEALGSVLGVKAEKGGMMAGISSLGKIRDSFKKALELDPRNFSAAQSLMTFYLEVPSLMGGSTSKAKDVIAEMQKINPTASNLLQAKLDLKDENFEKAKGGVLAVNANGNADIAQLQHEIAIEIAQTLVKDKKFTDAEKLLREVIQRFPDSSVAHLGLGRSLQEQGKAKEALLPLEKSLSIEVTGAALYRLGKTWQALGDKPKAISFFERALAFTPELGKKTRADAEEQLKLLK